MNRTQWRKLPFGQALSFRRWTL